MMHGGIIVLYSYWLVTLAPVKLTKSTSAHTAADVADKTSGFLSLRERGEEERDG